MAREKIKWLPFSFQEEGEMEAAFITGNCAAVSADVSQLAYERIAFHNMARNFEILPHYLGAAVSCHRDCQPVPSLRPSATLPSPR